MTNQFGRIEISQEYFSNLVGKAASECFGVAGMISSPTQGLFQAISGKTEPSQGVHVRAVGGKLAVDLHISVIYGMNISAIVKSIVHRVRYTIEQATNLEVAKVNVFVDSMKTENI